MVLWGLALIGPARLAAQASEPEQRECCPLLLVPVGARSSAVAGTLTARAGADAVFSNPAGLAGLDSDVFVVHHMDMSLGDQIDAFSLLLRPLGSTVGLSYQIFDKGEIPTTDPNNQPTGELSFRDHLLVVSASAPLPWGLAAGLNYKLFQNRVDCTGACGGLELAATTHALDVGLRYHAPWHPALELGVAVINLGFPLEIGPEQTEAFPARLHVGIAYDILHLVRSSAGVALRLSVDALDRLHEPGAPVPSFGIEADMQQLIYLRAGYTPGEGLGTGAAVGLGLRYDRFDIALARSFVNSTLGADEEPFQISFALNF